MIIAVVAYDRNRCIGKAGSIPWQGRLPDDMKHFAELTSGRTVVMGRKTWESIPERFRPLRGRTNIIISRSHLVVPAVSGATTCVCKGLDGVLGALAGMDADTYVIGGAEIYQQSLPLVNRVCATEIDAEFEGDVYFPKLDPEAWEKVHEEHHELDGRNHYPYAFVTYERRCV